MCKNAWRSLFCASQSDFSIHGPECTFSFWLDTLVSSSSLTSASLLVESESLQIDRWRWYVMSGCSFWPRNTCQGLVWAGLATFIQWLLWSWKYLWSSTSPMEKCILGKLTIVLRMQETTQLWDFNKIIPGTMERPCFLAVFVLSILTSNSSGSSLKVEKDICEKKEEEFNICSERWQNTCWSRVENNSHPCSAYEEYRKAIAAGDDGRPDWMARKSCNYVTAAVEVSLRLTGTFSNRMFWISPSTPDTYFLYRNMLIIIPNIIQYFYFLHARSVGMSW